MPQKLSRREEVAGISSRSGSGPLDNHTDENSVGLLVKKYSKMGSETSLKAHNLDAHLNKFTENMDKTVGNDSHFLYFLDISNYETTPTTQEQNLYYTVYADIHIHGGNKR